jgi:hypothetical protein
LVGKRIIDNIIASMQFAFWHYCRKFVSANVSRKGEGKNQATIAIATLHTPHFISLTCILYLLLASLSTIPPTKSGPTNAIEFL